MSWILVAKIIIGVGIFQILQRRIRAYGIVAGAVTSIFPIVGFLFSFGVLFVFLGGFVLAANQYDERQSRTDQLEGRFFDNPADGLEYSFQRGTADAINVVEFGDEEESAAIDTQ